ncbi:MAG: tRNA-dihydrouridine synthase, partial [Candidatus Woesearchaeota archaeon]|nr:tRNA-dihydrouridine synthase [Candidatus Woesearchaeota archaeon]
MQKTRIGSKTVSPFTIPSGIITTEPSCLESIADKIPEIGVLTTKSIGLLPRAGNREPIIAQYAPYCFVNAVGLTNPGAEAFSEKLQKATIPVDKFLLISIFGKDAEEFAQVARILEKQADGLELNLSCPHAKGYGMQLGQDPEMVKAIVAKVKTVTNKPIFAKLTPNTQNIAEIAKAAMEAGAYGITAINTVGPGAYMFDGQYVLTNKVGGLSGRGITPIGIKCAKDITDALGNIPMIVCGGIYTANDVKACQKARQQAKETVFGIGSALAGMTEAELKKYFSTIDSDLEHETNNAERLLKTVDMSYKKFRVAARIPLAEDFHILQMDGVLQAEPGQFAFAWLPEKGEKPFSVMYTDPLVIAFQERGCFTKALAKLERGDEIYFRGPYGKEI